MWNDKNFQTKEGIKVKDVSIVILEVVVAIVVILLSRYVIPYLKEITKSEKYAGLMEIVIVAVRAAEQTIRESGQGKVKKAQVVAFVTAWLNNNGLNISEDELDRLIESAVYNLKIEMEKA